MLFALFMIDTFIIQTLIQLVVLVVLIVILFFWKRLTKVDNKLLPVLVRFLQTLLGL